MEIDPPKTPDYIVISDDEDQAAPPKAPIKKRKRESVDDKDKPIRKRPRKNPRPRKLQTTPEPKPKSKYDDMPDEDLLAMMTKTIVPEIKTLTTPRIEELRSEPEVAETKMPVLIPLKEDKIMDHIDEDPIMCIVDSCPKAGEYHVYYRVKYNKDYDFDYAKRVLTGWICKKHFPDGDITYINQHGRKVTTEVTNYNRIDFSFPKNSNQRIHVIRVTDAFKEYRRRKDVQDAIYDEITKGNLDQYDALDKIEHTCYVPIEGVISDKYHKYHDCLKCSIDLGDFRF